MHISLKQSKNVSLKSSRLSSREKRTEPHPPDQQTDMDFDKVFTSFHSVYMDREDVRKGY